jgi:thiamine-phosphate pyrophosphorylase
MLDRFYLIVDSADWLARLLPCGVKLVQLRVKDKDDATLRTEISRARDLCKKFGAQLVVNDYWRLAIVLGCDYVHLGQEDMDSADFTAIRAAGMRFGLSTHDESELDRALSFKPDYVALGPVYPTILKQMRFGPQGLERVTQWKKLVGATPLVAIGGITVERAPGIFAAGADSVSVVTDVSLNKDPEARTREWVRVTRLPR